MTLKKLYSIVFTLVIVLAALLMVRLLWLHYMNDPWTRDARVRADVINIAPDVTGAVVALNVQDNQRVKKGDLLLQIDPARYELAVKRAQAQVEAQEAMLSLRTDEARRRADADALVVSRESRDQAERAAQTAKAELDQARAQLDAAQLDLERTTVFAPEDGYITNLNVHTGDYVHAGQASLALIDEHSFWVYGYFEETKLPLVKPGAAVDITMMSGVKMKGQVESIARGIYDADNPQSNELTANVSPTFDWVRLARRIPVRISIDEIPEGETLTAGTSCTVVLTGVDTRKWWQIF
ncbi:efflux RND transporter periplasmic adaptor subunit [Marinobacterium lutimaris]|uniref:RND family efflux transporter, MFP subunit n=1 Tax=Marinobacterium lutimaris TaxID=568106 RepID=A0A1H6BGX5_9GAMM|nr:efflux RND transporter periplasmic adaptor subunit [Marinobacterium lutimaris]SEG60021.1 RND family efflux transporter, MFP subunit [Marinobacterium lutimaris]